MKVLGFRGDPKAPRYAVVSEDNGIFTLENATSDSKLPVPASIGDEADAERLDWMYREVLAIIDAHPDIAKVVIKQNEFTQQDTKAKRRSAYNDAAVILASAHRNLPVEIKIYSSMATTSSDTKRHGEARVGKTDKYWDNKMADAVNAAWWGLHNR
ncbi:hypothetical protein WV31_08340 [Magnetospirillum sp. ME-1]|uniref:hypothetical protein n=1 Tax=Magnetospirillum sp. ME-1 TaxID=1639348 RepID=UPI000A17E566|nr:hypothetical protein [Magnetospirillum sp. ME-1]ARJ65662.1 hypothetical protein WV31_08340 [Magnetospirillum sp. ME-1]